MSEESHPDDFEEGSISPDELQDILEEIEECPDPPPEAPPLQHQVAEPELVDPYFEPLPAPLDIDASPEKSEFSQGVAEMLTKFSVSVDEIINNQRSDRDQVEEAIQTIKSALNAKLQNSDQKGLTPLLDNYIKALQVKSDINSNASRALDSVAKLMASVKNNDVIVNVQGGEHITGDLDLVALLSQPKKQDE